MALSSPVDRYQQGKGKAYGYINPMVAPTVITSYDDQPTLGIPLSPFSSGYTSSSSEYLSNGKYQLSIAFFIDANPGTDFYLSDDHLITKEKKDADATAYLLPKGSTDFNISSHKIKTLPNSTMVAVDDLMAIESVPSIYWYNEIKRGRYVSPVLKSPIKQQTLRLYDADTPYRLEDDRSGYDRILGLFKSGELSGILVSGKETITRPTTIGSGYERVSVDKLALKTTTTDGRHVYLDIKKVGEFRSDIKNLIVVDNTPVVKDMVTRDVYIIEDSNVDGLIIQQATNESDQEAKIDVIGSYLNHLITVVEDQGKYLGKIDVFDGTSTSVFDDIVDAIPLSNTLYIVVYPTVFCLYDLVDETKDTFNYSDYAIEGLIREGRINRDGTIALRVSRGVFRDDGLFVMFNNLPEIIMVYNLSKTDDSSVGSSRSSDDDMSIEQLRSSFMQMRSKFPTNFD